MYAIKLISGGIVIYFVKEVLTFFHVRGNEQSKVNDSPLFKI